MRPAARARYAVETFEDPGQLVGGDSGTCVADGEFEVCAGVPQFDFASAVEGEPAGIRYESENMLVPHLSIDMGRLGYWRPGDVEPQSRLLDCRAKDACKLRRERRKVYRFLSYPDAPGFNARKIKQRVDELEQPQTVALDEVDLLMDRARRCIGRVT